MYLLKFSTLIPTSCCEVSSRAKKTFANCSYSRWRNKDFSTTSLNASFKNNMIAHHFSKLKSIGGFLIFKRRCATSNLPNWKLDSLGNFPNKDGSCSAEAAFACVSPLSHVRDNCISKSPACSPHCRNPQESRLFHSDNGHFELA